MIRRVIAVMLIAVAVPVLAQETDAETQQLDTQIQSVALFKNGLGYFTRTGELPKAPAQIEIGPMPAASHGTLWLGWGEGVQFENLRSREVTATETREALSIDELIRANVGREVQISLPGQEKPLRGTILSYSEPETPAPPNPYLSVVPPQPEGRGVILIENAGGMGSDFQMGTLALSPNQIQRIIFLEDPATDVPVDSEHVAITGDLIKGRRGAPLSASYLARGMTWAPSYLVDISADGKALLTAKAVIINEIEDLAGATVDLVTGFPHLEYASVISPLARKQDLAGFLNALSQDTRRYMEPGVMAQAAMRGPAGPRGDYTPPPDYGAAAEGVQSEDLFFYPVEDVTLARGETGYYPLFSERVDYEHVYTWEIPDYIDERDHYQQPGGEREQVVWHSLRLQNETGMPWTTAPAETAKDGRILGQSTMHYTPDGGETLVKITQALGIQPDEVELETAREPNAHRFHGYTYDQVTVEGTLKMRSHLDREVTVEVTKMLTGEVQETSPQAEVVKLAAGLQRVNPNSRLTWELPLPAGETLEISYVYEVYVRN